MRVFGRRESRTRNRPTDEYAPLGGSRVIVGASAAELPFHHWQASQTEELVRCV